jgi:hypothetical protein
LRHFLKHPTRSNPASLQSATCGIEYPAKSKLQVQMKIILALLNRTAPHTATLNRAQIGPTAPRLSVRSLLV